jgi:hypothetical protein
MATEQQLKTLDKYIDAIHEILTNVPGSEIIKHKNLYARMFGQVLYEAPKLFTGQASIAMVDRKLNDFQAKPCAEHYLSRQRGGEALVDLVIASMESDQSPQRVLVQTIAMTYCAVHYTTQEENAALTRFQRNHHDEAAYNEAGIILIESRDLFTKRGHSQVWKQTMIKKYSPIVEHHLTSVGLIKDNNHLQEQ